MITVNPAHVANTFLDLAFKDNTPVNLMKLQKMVYFVAAETQKQPGHFPVFAERFQTWAYGPVLLSLQDQFANQPHSGIVRYAKNANKSSFLVPDGPVPGIVEWVWAAAKHHTPQELAEMTRLPGSAWDTAFQNGRPFLDDHDIANDLTYREPLLRGIRNRAL